MLKVMRHYYVPNVKDHYIVARLKAGKTFHCKIVLQQSQEYQNISKIIFHILQRSNLADFLIF